MKSVVVLYSGREGSSAIVSSLGKHSEINLPIFEHMDYSNVKQRFGQGVFDKIDVALNNLLSGYQFGDSIFKERGCDEIVKKNIAFKWRPWGDMEKVSAVFNKNKTVVFSLARKDVVNHALSKYFTNRVVSEGKGFYHPQFHVNKLSSDDREKYIKELREVKFNVKIDDYIQDLKTYVEAKKAMASRVEVLINNGVKVKNIFYEDFLEDKKMFLNSILTDLDLPYQESVNLSDFTKINKDDLRSQVLNYEEIKESQDVQEIVSEYCHLFGNLNMK